MHKQFNAWTGLKVNVWCVLNDQVHTRVLKYQVHSCTEVSSTLVYWSIKYIRVLKYQVHSCTEVSSTAYEYHLSKFIMFKSLLGGPWIYQVGYYLNCWFTIWFLFDYVKIKRCYKVWK